MLWRTSFCLLLFFYCTCNGQILLASLKEQFANVTSKQKLNSVNGTDSSMKALKAKRPYDYVILPSQWAHEPEAPYHWPYGIVRYYIDGDSYDDGILTLLGMVFDSIQYAVTLSCPRFVKLPQKPDEGDWLHFSNPDRIRPCVHDPAINRGGEIKIVLGYDCLKYREVLHTVMHGIGFRDEITHPGRDRFVRIMWENIQPAFRSMFRIESVEAANGLTEYDPTSIMQFHDRAYSVNGQPTIMPVLPGLKIEPAEELSRIDQIKIRRIFGHECKKQRIGFILNSCGTNDNIDVDDVDRNYGNNNICGNADRGRQIVIPGKDVHIKSEYDESYPVTVPGKVLPQGESEGSNEGGIVIPGKDVQAESANEGSDEANIAIDKVNYQSGNEGSIVVQGEDVAIGESNYKGGNENRVEGDETDDDDDTTALDGKSKLSKASHGLAPKMGELPSEEAIIVGYDALNKKLSNFQETKKLQKSLRPHKMSASGSASSDVNTIPDHEAIAAGYESRDK